MKSKEENVIGAMALALSDTVFADARRQVPQSMDAAGLTLIGHVPGLSIMELSKGLALSHPGAVRLVDRMVASGFVIRTRSEEDGRAVALTLTAAGEAQEDAVLRSRGRSLRSALSHLSDEEVTMLSHISEKLLTIMVTDARSALRLCRLCDSKACIGCPVDAKLEDNL